MFFDQPDADTATQLAGVRAAVLELESSIEALGGWRWLRRRLARSALADLRELEGSLAAKLARETGSAAPRRDREG